MYKSSTFSQNIFTFKKKKKTKNKIILNFYTSLKIIHTLKKSPKFNIVPVSPQFYLYKFKNS